MSMGTDITATLLHVYVQSGKTQAARLLAG